MARKIGRKVIGVGDSEAVTLPSWVTERIGAERGDQLMFYEAEDENGNEAVGLMRMPEMDGPTTLKTTQGAGKEGNGDTDE